MKDTLRCVFRPLFSEEKFWTITPYGTYDGGELLESTHFRSKGVQNVE